MLRACSLNTYGWRCEHEAVATFDSIAPALDPAYPPSWPKSVGQGLPAGTIALTHAIRFDVNRRLATIRRDMERAGPHYPREQVRAVLEFWKIKL